MHEYLKAIGFGEIDDYKYVYDILDQVDDKCDRVEAVALDDQYEFCMVSREFAPGIGIAIYGTIDEEEEFIRQYYVPYLEGRGITSYADTFMERRKDKESFIGICEDSKVGINLMFDLQNVIEFMTHKAMRSQAFRSASVTFSGLAKEGTILIPLMKDEKQTRRQREESRNRMMLQSAAKAGDVAALESLALDDMEIYSNVSKRIASEDIFTIVDTYMMPFGIECDLYSILGEILELREEYNQATGKKLYIMKLDVNELQFDVCVPADGLMGEPAVSRRFKGNIWLQGRINF